MVYPIFFNPFYKASDTVFVAGSGRSGTTWLGNSIASCPGFLSLFEPLDYRHVQHLNLSLLRPYIRPYNQSHPLGRTISDILHGKIRNPWVLSQNTRKITWRILIKEIRANLLLGYISSKFQSRIVFMLRHPCAVVLSKMELKWETHLDDFFKQEALMEDYLLPFEGLMHNARSDMEKHAIMWCVETLVPLSQKEKKRFAICMYENLIAKTSEEICRIFKTISLKTHTRMNAVLSKPTSVSNKQKVDLNREKQLTYWKSKLTKDEIHTILNTAGLFGIDIYNDDYMPNLNCVLLK